MKPTEDELRGLCDAAEDASRVVKLESRRKAREPTKPKVRELACIWADYIEINLDGSGVIDGLLPRTGMTVVYGESGAGKTFATIDLACHVATRRPWRGMAVEQGVVVYIAAEGPESVERRLYAWKKHHDVEQLPVLVVQSSVDLLNSDCEALAKLVAQVALERGRVALVVIDTLARAMVGNENAPEDMGKFVAACTSIREAGDTHILVVHHSGKDAARGARGHSSLRAATDVELEVTAGCIRVTKARDEEGGRIFGFKLEPFELGVNKHRRRIMTCVAVESDVEPKAETKYRRALPPAAQIAFDQLKIAISKEGEPMLGTSNVPGDKAGVRDKVWRERCYMAGISESEDDSARRKAFTRARQRLVAAKLCGAWGEWAWLL